MTYQTRHLRADDDEAEAARQLHIARARVFEQMIEKGPAYWKVACEWLWALQKRDEELRRPQSDQRLREMLDALGKR